MKYAKLIVRFIVMFAFASINLWVNILAVKQFKVFISTLSSDYLSALLAIAMFAYILLQMVLYAYLLYISLKSSCIKYGIKYC